MSSIIFPHNAISTALRGERLPSLQHRQLYSMSFPPSSRQFPYAGVMALMKPLQRYICKRPATCIGAIWWCSLSRNDQIHCDSHSQLLTTETLFPVRYSAELNTSNLFISLVLFSS